jgi:membrane-bound lytic murein transglycosylase F
MTLSARVLTTTPTVLVLVAVTWPILAAPVVAIPPEVVPFQALFQQKAGPRWIDRAAQVLCESGGMRKGTFYSDPQAVSPVGAQGPCQWMPSSWRDAQRCGWVPSDASPFDPPNAIQGQHAYMLWLEARVRGELDAALGSYNAGLGNILKARRLAQSLGLRGNHAWLQALPGVTGHHASETQGYVERNRRFRDEIRRRLKGEP